MKIVEVIPAKEWFNPDTGATASIYGAVPYHGEQGSWIIREVGFTWRTDQGTIGIGKRPAATRAEAERVMHNINNRVLTT